MSIRPGKRKRVFERDGNKCLLCHTTKHLTIDHIIPKSKGGHDGISNLQTLCKYHNEKKGNHVKDYRNRKGLPVMSKYSRN